MMQIVVRGKNVEVPKALQSAAEEKIAKIQRFVHDVSRVEVDFSELRNPRIADKELCEVTVHLKHHFVKARASAPEQEAALDLVIDKVEHQASRIKDKRISRSRPAVAMSEWLRQAATSRAPPSMSRSTPATSTSTSTTSTTSTTAATRKS